MAQAFYERLGGEARSAGSRPEDELHPEVVEAMSEIGVDLTGRSPTLAALRATPNGADMTATCPN